MKFLRQLLSFFLPRCDLYIFGSSILWGQGHLPGAKIGGKVAAFIRAEFKQRPVVYLMAHSGAVLEVGTEPVSAPLHGEVPCPWPSVLSQVRTAPKPKSDRIRILLEGGINDVGGVRISSPSTSREYIEQATERACYHGVGIVLKALFERFPHAEVYVLGYYQILAERADRKDIEEMLDREGLAPVQDGADSDLAERAIGNTRLFRERSDHWLRKACYEAAAGNGGSCAFVSSGFSEREGMFGKPTLLFHPWSNDPMMGVRARKCTLALARGQTGLHCFLAATAHPNEGGIDRYVSSIVAALSGKKK